MLAHKILTEEWLADVLQDSIEMDWTSSDGARAIMRALECGLVELPQPCGQIIASPNAASAETVAFVQEWMMSGDHEPTQWDRDFAAAIDARCNAASADTGEREANLEAQRQAIEASARIADVHAEQTDTPSAFTEGYEIAAKKIARAIRKLVPNESLALTTAGHDVRALREGEREAGRAWIISEARKTLRLVQGCMECSADDERRWCETIEWLEKLA